MNIARAIEPDRRRIWATNLLIAAMGLTVFAALNALSGRVDANDGLGWDGRQYAHMVTDRLVDGTVATQTRPLLPLLTRIPYAAGLDIVSAFQFMNVVYAAALYFSLCLILDLYGVATRYKLYFVAIVALCIATSKILAFYPTLIDLGGLAVLSAATYLVLTTQRGWVAGCAALLAVASRESGVALALFGFHRSVRQGRAVLPALLTYAPAVALLVFLRQWASATNLGDRDRDLLAAQNLLANLALWRNPAFAMFFAYFLLTLLGGITLLLAVRARWSLRTLAGTPELATFALLILAASATNGDIWRFMVYLLPVIAILFAAYVREFQPGPVVLSGALLMTVITQQPFTRMDMTQYFRDWFPVYLLLSNDATPEFWAIWRLRLAITAAGAVALAIVQWKTRVRPAVPAR
jgi:hypothetical protein